MLGVHIAFYTQNIQSQIKGNQYPCAAVCLIYMFFKSISICKSFLRFCLVSSAYGGTARLNGS